MPKSASLGRIHSRAAASTVRASAFLSNESPVKRELVDKGTGDEKRNENLEERDEEKNSNTLSRGQKKRLAKREQFVKREKMILSSLRIQRAEEQKKRIDGMDALKEALNEAMSNNTNPHPVEDDGILPAIQVKTNHSKRAVAQKEIEHMHLVLQHPSFVQQPFATMQEHLRNTFSRQAMELQRKADEARKIEKDQSLQRKELRRDRIRDAKFDAVKARAKRRRM
jgi:hypothetical protein